MPSKFRLRKVFAPLIRVLAKRLSQLGVTPNFATTIMLFCAILSCIFLVLFSNLILFAIFVFLTGIFDGIDGAIARITNKSTAFGGFFDSMMDRCSEFVIFLALLMYCWNRILWYFLDMKIVVFFCFFASIMISYSRARAEVFFKGDFKGDFDIGLLARSERLFSIFLISLVSFFIKVYNLDIFNELLFIFLLLLLLTAIFRSVKIKKQIEDQEKNSKY